ncbi:S8 family peptidase [Nonomuraea zeae]|uniref:S8/S53 family peptidase n=1 Tax=Nonomuraea zeae TaxID=1642303 RepID=A0A5S4FXH8_9ACTN|nr:S8/S53 family peptidase [Nonomuraea zeae]TMR25527.1 S8/S53 family peptidase [Nonomuraea zeae]
MTIDYIPEPPTEGGTEQFGLPWQGITLPPAVLDRHGARILDPWAVPLDKDETPPDSTVYRARVLLIPGQALAAQESSSWIDANLSRLGVRISQDSVDNARRRDYPEQPVWMPATLEATGDLPDVDPDAWRALRELRRACRDQAGGVPLEEFVTRASLDHLYVGSGVDGIGADLGGAPATSGHGVIDESGVLSHAGYGRMPVTLMSGPPRRRSIEELGGDRITVVTLDTGVVRDHPWFRPWTDDDAFLTVDPQGQAMIEAVHPTQGGRPVARLVGFEDLGELPNPLVGTLNTHTGHGLMIAGLIAQLAPDARVLMYKVMHDDGIVPGEAVHAAVDRLLDRMRSGFTVDVLCLAFGGFAETGQGTQAMQALFEKVNELRARGVIVVNAAGNYSTTRPFYLAAHSDTVVPNGPPLAPMLGVAAKNPDDTIAIFSNENPAVRWRAPGAMLVSTFPPNVQGAQSAALTNGRRTSLDGDSTSPFRSWSGTSFAAPIVAGVIAARLTATVNQVNVDRMRRAHDTIQQMISEKVIRPEITPI